MIKQLAELTPQPLTGIFASGLASLVLLQTWLTAARTGTLGFDILLLPVALFLYGALLLAARYPIHVRQNTKVMIITAPMFLIAVLLPPPLAALIGGLGMLSVALMLSSQLGTRPSDIATTTGRWILVAYASSLIAHLGTDSSVSQVLVLLAAAGTMFVGDVVGSAFEIAPMSGEPPWRVFRMLIHEMVLVEAVQYLIGILGALVALQHMWALVLLALPTIIIYIAFKNVKEMRESTRQLLEGMADAVDLRDPYTGGHSRRVAEFCKGILDTLHIAGVEADLIVSAARVHDIGKIGIPDIILKKPGILTREERKIMESHSELGANLLARYTDFARGKEIVRHHHEHWNGKGYPRKLKGYDIPLGARIIAVADSFDAMTSDRPYRNALSVEHAALTLHNGRGEQWDPRVVGAFLVSIAERLPQTFPAAPGELVTLPRTRADQLQVTTS